MNGRSPLIRTRRVIAEAVVFLVVGIVIGTLIVIASRSRSGSCRLTASISMMACSATA
jgi:hypothetical protein